jgi:hypothetical protein
MRPARPKRNGTRSLSISILRHFQIDAALSRTRSQSRQFAGPIKADWGYGCAAKIYDGTRLGAFLLPVSLFLTHRYAGRGTCGRFFSLSAFREGTTLDELVNWLTTQHNGLRTYRAFEQKVLQLAENDPQHLVVFFLLAAHVRTFVDAFDEEPLPSDIADQAFKRLVELAKMAGKAMAQSAADQLKALNEIAAAKLVDV